MKDNLYEKVKKYIAAHGMIQAGDCIVAGISGGADSVCMLRLLARMQKEIPFRLVVVHVNHGLRAEAKEDAAFVEELCRRWEIPFFCGKWICRVMRGSIRCRKKRREGTCGIRLLRRFSGK